MFGRLKDWRRVATRYDRRPTILLSAAALAATVLFWLCALNLIVWLSAGSRSFWYCRAGKAEDNPAQPTQPTQPTQPRIMRTPEVTTRDGLGAYIDRPAIN